MLSNVVIHIDQERKHTCVNQLEQVSLEQVRRLLILQILMNECSSLKTYKKYNNHASRMGYSTASGTQIKSPHANTTTINYAHLLFIQFTYDTYSDMIILQYCLPHKRVSCCGYHHFLRCPSQITNGVMSKNNIRKNHVWNASDKDKTVIQISANRTRKVTLVKPWQSDTIAEICTHS